MNYSSNNKPEAEPQRIKEQEHIIPVNAERRITGFFNNKKQLKEQPSFKEDESANTAITRSSTMNEDPNSIALSPKREEVVINEEPAQMKEEGFADEKAVDFKVSTMEREQGTKEEEVEDSMANKKLESPACDLGQQEKDVFEENPEVLDNGKEVEDDLQNDGVASQDNEESAANNAKEQAHEEIDIAQSKEISQAEDQSKPARDAFKKKPYQKREQPSYYNQSSRRNYYNNERNTYESNSYKNQNYPNKYVKDYYYSSNTKAGEATQSQSYYKQDYHKQEYSSSNQGYNKQEYYQQDYYSRPYNKHSNQREQDYSNGYDGRDMASTGSQKYYQNWKNDDKENSIKKREEHDNYSRQGPKTSYTTAIKVTLYLFFFLFLNKI